MSAELGIAATETETPEFLEIFSGNWPSSTEAMAWATPYGASVNGSFSADSPFGLWGYGDGRAMSIGHFRGSHHTWELQLKGTPFSRNFDGRAVLRSSVREFLASEAMHSLGVPTTRCLSLVASSQRVTRSWLWLDAMSGEAFAATTSVQHAAVSVLPDYVGLQTSASDGWCRSRCLASKVGFLRVVLFLGRAQRAVLEVPVLLTTLATFLRRAAGSDTGGADTARYSHFAGRRHADIRVQRFLDRSRA
eukprot:s6354_g3.t1